VTRLLVATRSRGKQAEFRTLLAPLGGEIVFPDDIGLAPAVEEEGLERFETFAENARAKAAWFAARSGLPTLADDSGLEVDALGGEPGVHSKRFAGREGPDHLVTAANNDLLLARLGGIPPAARTARYRCVIAWHDPVSGAELTTDGVTEGRIAEALQGTGGFGYDPLFVSAELGVTFGVASRRAKDAVSHRGRAAAAMVAALQSRGV
jgi:XTP/dITP diphosphohydrolase